MARTARYPTRAPAKAKALLMVRLTARFGWPSSSVRALGVPRSRNSMYASSTTSTGCASAGAPSTDAAAHTPSRVSSWSMGSGVPVGLLGLVTTTIDAVRIVRMPYHLSAVTQAAALAAFEHTDELLAQVGHLRETRQATAEWLKTRSWHGQALDVAESQSNFLLFGGHFEDRQRIFDELLRRGVLIRVVGPDGWLRVCMGTDEEMARFRQALDEVLAQG